MKPKHLLCVASLAVICLASAVPVHADDDDDAEYKQAVAEHRLLQVFRNHIDKQELASKTAAISPPDVGLLYGPSGRSTMAVFDGYLVAKMEIVAYCPDISTPGTGTIGANIYDTSLKIPLEEFTKAGFAVIAHEDTRTAFRQWLKPEPIRMRIFEIKPNDKTDAVSLAIRNDFLDDKRIYHSVARAFRLEYAKIKDKSNREKAAEAVPKTAEALKNIN